MDFEAIWNTHKPFILKVMGGALAFLILLGISSSISGKANGLARANAAQQSGVMGKLADLKGSEGLEKGRADSLANKLEPSLTKTIMWKPDSAYVLPKGDSSPTLFYDGARRKAIRAIERHAEQWNARVPSGGELSLPEQVEAEYVPEALARADIVRRVVTKVLDAGARNITAVGGGEAEYTARKGDERFLRTLPVSVTFQGTIKLLAKVLAEFQVEGNFLELRTCRMNRQGDKPDAPIEIELTMQALEIVDKAPAKAASAARTGGTTRSGGTRRVRNFQRER